MCLSNEWVAHSIQSQSDRVSAIRIKIFPLNPKKLTD